MSIASRINEMTEHLRNGWGSIDKLGLDITEENSNDNLDKNIENIAPVLDRFYNQASDKIDLSENGIVGKTSQESTTGKNLFDKSLITSIGGTIKYIPINVKKNTDYTLSTNSGTSTLANVFLSTTNSGVTTNNNGAIIDQPRTINSSDNNIMYVGYRNDLSSYWIQLEESSTATSYEPYTGGEPSPSPDYPQEVNNISGNIEYRVRGQGISEIFPLSLGDIELCNISDYKDRIYSQNGEFYLEKKTDKVVFDGSENWTINTSYTYNVFYRTLGNYARISNTQTTYCEYYKGIENTAGIVDFGNNYNNSIGVRTANDNIKDIYISNNSITSASDFKTWLSTHNTVVYYVLATPTTTEITQENYPTLYSQLFAIQEFLTKYKINKEFLLDYSSPEIEY